MPEREGHDEVDVDYQRSAPVGLRGERVRGWSGARSKRPGARRSSVLRVRSSLAPSGGPGDSATTAASLLFMVTIEHNADAQGLIRGLGEVAGGRLDRGVSEPRLDLLDRTRSPASVVA